MGKEVVYCSKCGTMLREREFARGLAHTHLRQPYCVKCRPLSTPTFPVASDHARVPLLPKV